MRFLVLFCVAAASRLGQAEDVTVMTEYGAVRGTKGSLHNAKGPIKSVRRFLGIPFASPPVGELRFRPPEPPKSWKPDTRDAQQWGNVCMQPESPWSLNVIRMMWANFSESNLSEDCLYLNVFSPDTNSSPLPVMVYIHGGGFFVGASVARPGDMLALQGRVVVVTIQYRLGALGFLSTGDSAAPGNFGMLDQVEALKWVQQNIRAFGGDPTNVTIFGLSAGGASVGLQLLSPLSKGLFHRAISESGTDVAAWATHTTASAARHTKSLAGLMLCTGDSEEIVDCLRSKPAKDLTKLGTYVSFKNFEVAEDRAWSPVVDKRFLHDTPKILRRKGDFHKVPYLAGVTSHEGSMFLNESVGQYAGGPSVDAGVDPETFVKFLDEFGKRNTDNEKNAALVSDALRFEYTPWPETSKPNDLRRALVETNGDHQHVVPTIKAMSVHSKFSPAFMFLFSHVSKMSKFPAWMGAQHGDSTFYVFGVPFMDPKSYDDTDRNVSLFMMQTFTNFAKTGKPTPEAVSGVQWSQFTACNQTYVNINGASPEVGKNYRPGKVAFWSWYLPKLVGTEFDSERPMVGSNAPSTSPLAPFTGTLMSVLFALLFPFLS